MAYPRSGHEGYCYRHSKKPLVLPTDWALDKSLTDIHALKAFAEEQRALGRKLYIGLAGVSKSSTILGEIDNDERRMIELGLMTRKLAHSYVILKPLGDEPGHNRARLGEAWLIRELGLNTLMNERNGGAGRLRITMQLEQSLYLLVNNALGCFSNKILCTSPLFTSL